MRNSKRSDGIERYKKHSVRTNTDSVYHVFAICVSQPQFIVNFSSNV